MHVQVDRDKCSMYGECVFVAPEVFALEDEDDAVRLLLVSPPAELQERVAEAATLCPARAIRVGE